MGAEYGHSSVGNLVQSLDETRAFLLQRLHDMLIMDDLVAHKDGFAEFLQRSLNDIYGADNASAETTRLGKHDAHQNEFPISHAIITTFRQNRAGRNGANSAGK